MLVTKSDRSKKTALLFAIFGGWFGLHCYYAGKIGKGLLYTFTFGLFCFGWFFDIIKILTGTFCDGAGAPIRE